jgi:FAD synthase
MEYIDIEAAEKLLGRHYVVAGEVIHGNALGRELGFPTINLGHGAEQYVLLKPVYTQAARRFAIVLMKASIVMRLLAPAIVLLSMGAII